MAYPAAVPNFMFFFKSAFTVEKFSVFNRHSSPAPYEKYQLKGGIMKIIHLSDIHIGKSNNKKRFD